MEIRDLKGTIWYSDYLVKEKIGRCRIVPLRHIAPVSVDNAQTLRGECLAVLILEPGRRGERNVNLFQHGPTESIAK